jgi:hypothetical protein
VKERRLREHDRRKHTSTKAMTSRKLARYAGKSNLPACLDDLNAVRWGFFDASAAAPARTRPGRSSSTRHPWKAVKERRPREHDREGAHEHQGHDISHAGEVRGEIGTANLSGRLERRQVGLLRRVIIGARANLTGRETTTMPTAKPMRSCFASLARWTR